MSVACDHRDRDEVKRRAEADVRGLFADCGGELRTKGNQRCIFHEDKKPSVSLAKGRYKCFSCGASYDAIEFVQKAKGLDFREALAYLADRYGVRLENAPLNEATRREYINRRYEQELIEHCRLIHRTPRDQAEAGFRERCALEPGYETWLHQDLAHAEAACALIVGMLAIAAHPGDKLTPAEVRYLQATSAQEKEEFLAIDRLVVTAINALKEFREERAA